MLRKKVSHIQICDPSKKIKRSLALKMFLYLIITADTTKQAVKFSADARNSAVFDGFLVISEFNVNLGRNLRD